MNPNSIAQASWEYEQLLEFVRRQPDGTMLTYKGVQAALEIDMQLTSNRTKLRNAILASKRRYAVIPGIGYELSHSKSAHAIMVHAIKKVQRGAVRAEKTGEVLTDRHGSQMTKKDKQVLDEARYKAAQASAVFESVAIARRQAAVAATQPKPRRSPAVIQVTEGERTPPAPKPRPVN